MNKLEQELHDYVVSLNGKAVTAEYLNAFVDQFKQYSVRQIKYNLNRVRSKVHSIHEGYENNGGSYSYSTGYYYDPTIPF